MSLCRRPAGNNAGLRISFGCPGAKCYHSVLTSGGLSTLPRMPAFLAGRPQLFCGIPELQVVFFFFYSIAEREERSAPRLHTAIDSRFPSACDPKATSCGCLAWRALLPTPFPGLTCWLARQVSTQQDRTAPLPKSAVPHTRACLCGLWVCCLQLSPMMMRGPSSLSLPVLAS